MIEARSRSTGGGAGALAREEAVEAEILNERADGEENDQSEQGTYTALTDHWCETPRRGLL
jgi:hypothetical protein